ncbi:Cytochrome c1-1, heme protein, mitochondrial [Capsicum chinense]|nr:Cytochrome c1-1, heme protein, mitochondrial [Capsicum chinense]
MKAEIEVFEGPNDESEMFTPGSKLSDHFSLPCANEAAVRFSYGRTYHPNPSLLNVFENAGDSICSGFKVHLIY